jgi:hypothetical protein
MGKKQVIRLTESDIHNIVKEAVNSILIKEDIYRLLGIGDGYSIRSRWDEICREGTSHLERFDFGGCYTVGCRFAFG